MEKTIIKKSARREAPTALAGLKPAWLDLGAKSKHNGATLTCSVAVAVAVVVVYAALACAVLAARRPG